jgi:hypothetical protein
VRRFFWQMRRSIRYEGIPSNANAFLQPAEFIETPLSHQRHSLTGHGDCKKWISEPLQNGRQLTFQCCGNCHIDSGEQLCRGCLHLRIPCIKTIKIETCPATNGPYPNTFGP